MLSLIKQNVIVDKHFYKDNITLAIPIITANMGQALVGIVDNIMVGRLGATELAAASLGSMIVMNTLVFGMGMALSLTPLAGKAFATRSYRKAAFFFENSISLNTMIGLVLAAILLSALPLLDNIGQDPEVVKLAKPFYIYVAISVFPYMIFLSFKQFLEGIGNTKVSMIITICANLLNVLLNWMFIYGKLGCPAMGVAGAGLATLISRVSMPVAFYIYTMRNLPYKRFYTFFSLKSLTIRRHLSLFKVGLPISLQMLVEFFALSMTAIMMGWIGAKALAANQIVLSVMSFMFMVTSGMAGAVTILVSHESGKHNRREILGYSKSALQMSAVFMFCAALIFIFVGEYIAMAFIDDAEVIVLAGKIFLVAAMFEISDGIQVTALGALRGLTDVTKPMIYAIIAYLVINIPLAYVFGFILDWGVQGVWLGFFCGLTTAAILFVRRVFNQIKIGRF